eukprot:gnl/MRDRNA2_/MRDRNA2_78529_c0_seq1.p1 gnl/MRDRNA2_/MRDRNA2_78529_c0~~gnl/MRDRNA2_/MRDRNA2_78529_c0_seq1.p1  ORF type:complete len:290 (+),score=-19.84 gnl/MRDRNA2_/MRDRNA2_78529_c0_seq1:61-930(+)
MKRGLRKKHSYLQRMMKTLASKNISGILSGANVWLLVDVDICSILESMAIGTLDYNTEANSCLGDLFPSEQKGNFIPTRLSRSVLIRLGAEETCFLMHVTECLQIYKGINQIDAWTNLLFGLNLPLVSVHWHEIFLLFSSTLLGFFYRYPAYFHYRSNGWIVKSGIQFGSDFVLYRSHPSRVHSVFSVSVVFMNTTTNILPKWYVKENCNELINIGYSIGLNKQIKTNWHNTKTLSRVQTRVSKELKFCYVSFFSFDRAITIAKGVQHYFNSMFIEEFLLQRKNFYMET